MKKQVHNKKTGARNLRSSPKPETRTTAKNSHVPTSAVAPPLNVSMEGGSALPPFPREQNDRCLWKHYLPSLLLGVNGPFSNFFYIYFAVKNSEQFLPVVIQLQSSL